MTFKFDNLSVLVVEDVTPMNKLICSVLQILGIGHVMSAQNGEQGFKVF